MKKTITVIAAVVALAVPATASAAWSGQGNSTPGIDRYDALYGVAADNAQCDTQAGSGAFGYLGKDNNQAGGADGQQTGINNSSVCGNRANAPGQN